MRHTRFVQVFSLDAAVTGVVGLLLVVGGGRLEGLLGLPSALLRGVGLSFILFAGLVAYVAQQRSPRVNLARFVIGYNVLWVLVSGLFLLTRSPQPTLLGTGFVLFQAFIVAFLAVLQLLSLKSLPSTAAGERSL